jgi:Pvc16 N-terminal domain
MSDFTAVERVSRAIQRVLTDALVAVGGAVPPVAQLDHLQPPPTGQPPVLTLFLYEIVEDHTIRNRDQRHELETVQGQQRYRVTRPPMPLVLRYLMTAWAADRNTELLMIGRAMQVLYQRQVRRGADLDPELDLPLLSITLAPLSLDERSRVWWAIQQPYRLSLNYEVRVVDIDVSGGDVELLGPVRERELAAHFPAGRR